MKAQEHPEYSHEQANLERAQAALSARLEALAKADVSAADDRTSESLYRQFRAEYTALQ